MDFHERYTALRTRLAKEIAVPGTVTKARLKKMLVDFPAYPKLPDVVTPPPVVEPPKPPAPAPVGPPGRWTLAFSDDFEGTALDPAKWVVADGQYKQNRMTPAASNVSVANGEVRLALSVARTTGDWGADEAHNRGAQIHSGKHNNHPWNSSGPYHAPVGSYVEARVLIPGDGRHLHNWSAFWTCAEGWPTGGEHDVVEALQFSSGEGANAYAVYHFGSDGGAGKGSTRVHAQTAYMGDTWHTYGVHRKADSADYYWDGVLVRSIPTKDNGTPHAIVLTNGVLGVGGDRPPVLGLAGAMRVDWVRSWHPAPVPA